MSFDFPAYVQQCRERADSAIAKALTKSHCPQKRLLEAMSYSATNGGKRVRPLLVMAGAEACGNSASPAVDSAAAAIEMMHAYSLVHDDLPAMDDDKLRRGLPTCHIAFDEATAILAGDALQSQAFSELAELPNCPDKIKLQLIQELASAAGAAGMVAGQAIDLASVNQRISLAQLEQMHQLKTGRIIRAAIRMGAIASGRSQPDQLRALDDYADAIGLAFQVQDDILDVTADTATLGKQQGADEELNKPTYVSLLGLDAAKTKAEQLRQDAHQALAAFGPEALALRALADYIVQRAH
ncbi:(2E,6E)-farnesyl diphosphate synthase [Pseudoteredinibacter isoporae]|uniref:Geranylgeranyl pyrophosphate synthase n=1 Tax=Pseudoteredinibacter isoporae TaxID=570281 RepID=A0A7X0JWZ9_9GAMM|nr:geranylgeranyl pyrophosphate synthase [Pseudoteredinibacter isoporae]NHO89303.1 (2E,6E)-farnesyl diphosphate synthase [Pseudoteredinibacter isoporae]NIB22410.1 (2E,6E)-farnesyl diphosphate synthase [Pseudoteredinibacter isoporae]